MSKVYLCPICDYQGIFKDIIEHFKTTHNENLRDNPFTYTRSTSCKALDVYLLFVFDSCFVVRSGYSVFTRKFTDNVQMLEENGELLSNYKFCLEVQSNKGKLIQRKFIKAYDFCDLSDENSITTNADAIEKALDTLDNIKFVLSIVQVKQNAPNLVLDIPQVVIERVINEEHSRSTSNSTMAIPNSPSNNDTNSAVIIPDDSLSNNEGSNLNQIDTNFISNISTISISDSSSNNERSNLNQNNTNTSSNLESIKQSSETNISGNLSGSNQPGSTRHKVRMLIARRGTNIARNSTVTIPDSSSNNERSNLNQNNTNASSNLESIRQSSATNAPDNLSWSYPRGSLSFGAHLYQQAASNCTNMANHSTITIPDSSSNNEWSNLNQNNTHTYSYLDPIRQSSATNAPDNLFWRNRTSSQVRPLPPRLQKQADNNERSKFNQNTRNTSSNLESIEQASATNTFGNLSWRNRTPSQVRPVPHRIQKQRRSTNACVNPNSSFRNPMVTGDFRTASTASSVSNSNEHPGRIHQNVRTSVRMKARSNAIPIINRSTGREIFDEYDEYEYQYHW